MKFYVQDPQLKKLYQDWFEKEYDPLNAGFDLRCADDVVVSMNGVKEVSSGLCVEIPQGYFGILTLRSSMTRNGYKANIGIIDSNYRGEVGIIFETTNRKNLTDYFKKGDRIAQLIIVPYMNFTNASFIENKNEMSTTKRKGGFGSTGLK